MQIENITLHNALPQVFAEARPAGSQVWLTTMDFRRGAAYLVEADSGTGKSSLCSYLYGWRNDYMGMIEMNGRDIRTFSVDEWVELRRRHLAYLPQEMAIFPELTAMENIQIKNRLTDYCSQAEINRMLEAFELSHKANVVAAKLSIGQQQRVAIIRTLCQPCDFILLDEPVSHLDERNNRMAAQMITKYAQSLGAGIIATSVGNPLLLSQTPQRITL